MKYEKYTVWDFIEDDYFVTWVKDSHEQGEQFWKKWLAHNPQKAEDIQLARHIISNIEYKEDSKPTELELVDVFEHIVRGRQKEEQKKLSGGISSYRTLLKYAAIFIIALTVSFSLWHINSEEVENKVLTEVAMIEKSNPRGMKSTIKLNDGTMVMLNSETLISYPEYFSDSLRVVYLEGEAFFEVERDESRPFIVISQNIQTRVLGTSFNVRSFASENEVSVGVVEGKVQVIGETQSGVSFDHELFPNQMSVVNFEQKVAYKGNFEAADATAWKDWTLKFKSRPLKDIFNEIEKWYAVDLEIASDIDLAQVYSGSFQNEPLKAVLEGLGHNAEFDYKAIGKKVTITKKLSIQP